MAGHLGLYQRITHTTSSRFCSKASLLPPPPTPLSELRSRGEGNADGCDDDDDAGGDDGGEAGDGDGEVAREVR